jgi:molybdenum cofactor synthesis domain-containing protein
MTQLDVVSVNVSTKKGTIKNPVDAITLNPEGIEGDAHAGAWHRQVSLLDVESIEKMQTAIDRKIDPGEFAENITTRGYPVYKMRPLDRLVLGQIELEVTQIGKKCHGHKCAIFKRTGDCVMPKEGIFCRVLKGGTLRAGDRLDYQPKVVQVHVITLSDRASSGAYEDKSGPMLKERIADFFSSQQSRVEIRNSVIPDEAEQLRSLIKRFVDAGADIVFTTGGTGIGPRDIAPEVIRPLLDKEIPGIMELIRVKYGASNPNALVSRSVAGLISKTLIYALPGSPKAVSEYTDEILKTIDHSLMMVNGIDRHG